MSDALQPIQYKVTPTGMRFHNSTSKIKFVLGPFGSGKSVMCSEELLYNAMRQVPGSNGVRYSRYAIVRRAYPDLKTTTRRTLMMCLPASCGYIKETVPMEGEYRFSIRSPETGEMITLNMELILIAVDGTEESLAKLRSMDLTGAWVNETTEASYDIITTLNERVGRFPAGEMGTAVEPIIIGDYNMPPYGHWLLEMAKAPAPRMEFFVQPPAAFYRGDDADGLPIFECNPRAENLEVLNAAGKTYYQDQIDTQVAKGRYDKVKQLLCLIPGVDESGKPVYHNVFDPAEHILHDRKPNKGPVVMGIDTSGIHPGAVIAQQFDESWVILHELYGDTEGFEAFRDSMLLPLLKTHFPESEYIAVCDPANARDSWTGVTPVERLTDVGIKAFVANSNTISIRIDASKSMLNKRKSGGVYVLERCERLVTALSGGYKYRKLGANAGVDIYSTTPVKDDHSHMADAFQYLCLHLTAGEGSTELQERFEQAIMNQGINRKKRRYF